MSRDLLDLALSGRFAHPDPAAVVAGLTAEAAGARVGEAPRTIHELVGHLVYWQDVTLAWIDGVEPAPPADLQEPWPTGPEPESAEAWAALAGRFTAGLERAREIAAGGELDAPMTGMEEATVAGVLQVMAAHNSWHLGQIVMLRRRLGEWPGEGIPNR